MVESVEDMSPSAESHHTRTILVVSLVSSIIIIIIITIIMHQSSPSTFIRKNWQKKTGKNSGFKLLLQYCALDTDQMYINLYS